MMTGMLGDRNTSQLSGAFRVVRPDLDVLLSDSACVERAWLARIGQVEAVTRAIPRASAKNSRLEVIMVFSDLISLILF